MLLSCCLPLDGHLATDSSDLNSYWLKSSITNDPDPILNVSEVRNSCWSICYGDSYCFVLLIVVRPEFLLGAVTYTADHVPNVPDVKHFGYLVRCSTGKIRDEKERDMGCRDISNFGK